MQVGMKRPLYCLAFCLAMVLAHTGQAFAQQSKSGDLVIVNAWSRATPPGARIGAGYLVIKNRGTVADRLIGGTSDVSRTVEIRATTVKDGMMTMEHMAGGLLIEPARALRSCLAALTSFSWICTPLSNWVTHSKRLCSSRMPAKLT
jgi:hypothetical protein